MCEILRQDDKSEPELEVCSEDDISRYSHWRFLKSTSSDECLSFAADVELNSSGKKDNIDVKTLSHMNDLKVLKMQIRNDRDTEAYVKVKKNWFSHRKNGLKI